MPGNAGATALVYHNEIQSHVCHGRSPGDQRLEAVGAVGALDAGDQVLLAAGSGAPIALGPATLLREPTDASRLAQAPRQRALAQITENRTVWTRKPLIFQ